MDIDNKISFDLSLQAFIANKLANIDSFKIQWKNSELSKPEKLLRELKEFSTIQSIGASTRIEGSTLTDAEIKELINNLDINKLQSRDEEEVIGYYDTIDLISDNYQNIFLSESYIKQLHNELLKYNSKDTRHKGSYKSLSNKVVAHYPDGTSKVVFDTTEPYLVASEMHQLLDWTNDRLGNPCIHPLLIVSAFIYEFLSIHPFQDGNGRLSRLLTNLLMLKLGYSFVHYVSFEKVIEDRKKEYYQNLMECQKHRYSDKENISQWTIFFLDSIENLIIRLQTKLNQQEPNLNINPRQKQILEYLKTNQGVKISDICKNFTDISRAIIKVDLKALMNKNLISSSGQGRGTYYQAVS